jgi:hypothetical protein
MPYHRLPYIKTSMLILYTVYGILFAVCAYDVFSD